MWAGQVLPGSFFAMKEKDIITSPSNTKIKHITALLTKTKARRQEKSFVMEGARMFTDAPMQYIREVFCTEEALQKADGRLMQKLKILDGEGRLFLITPELLKKISDTEHPQGVLCIAAMPPERIPEPENPLYLLLENIQDPGNLGTMIRTAEAAGCDGVIMSRGTVDLYNPKTVRSTMSSIFRMPCLRTDDFQNLIERLKERGVSVFAAHLDGKRNYDQVSYTGGTAFLIGNEGNGLTASAAAAASQKILIPMRGEIESLNAAMAAGILLFEAARQRRNNS